MDSITYAAIIFFFIIPLVFIVSCILEQRYTNKRNKAIIEVSNAILKYFQACNQQYHQAKWKLHSLEKSPSKPIKQQHQPTIEQ